MFDWFRRDRNRRAPLAAWRASWAEAIERDATITAGQLRSQLEPLRGQAADVEVELEMLDALEALRQLQARIGTGQVPVLETHHRVIGSDACHFSAPASLPDDASHTSGRVLFTATRAIFVGGGRTAGTAWHQVHEVLRSERDLLLVRADHTPAGHFRFNTFADAVTAACLARHLRNARLSRL